MWQMNLIDVEERDDSVLMGCQKINFEFYRKGPHRILFS